MTKQGLGRVAPDPGPDPAPTPAADRGWDVYGQRMFDKLFTPADVAGWREMVEISGDGHLSEHVLRGSPAACCWHFGASRAAAEAMAARMPDLASAGRLRTGVLDPSRPDAMLAALEAAGRAGQVDAVFSIDAMQSADLPSLATHWLNAALVLKPGGRLLMTLADATTSSGFQKILRDIRRFYRFQGRPSAKFAYGSAEIVRAVLGRFGFAVELLEAWSPHEGRPPRDLYLSARLLAPERARAFRQAMQPSATQEPALSYGEWWDAHAARATSGQPDRPPARAVFEHLLIPAEAETWRRAVEIGPGDGRFTAEILRANPSVKLTVFDVSDKVMQATATRLRPHVAAGRLGFQPIDPVRPDGMLTSLARAGLTQDIDAVFSIDALIHVDLQYLVAYWLNAALMLRLGGWLVFNVADATTETGFARLMADLPRRYASPGQVGDRLEFLSFGLVRPILERFGFEITYASHWNPLDGSQSGRDLYVVARLVRPEAAEALHGHIATDLPMPQQQPPDAGQDRPPPELAEANAELTRILGQAIWRQAKLHGLPAPRPGDGWAESRRDYQRFAQQVLRDLAETGITLQKAAARLAGQAAWQEDQIPPESD